MLKKYFSILLALSIIFLFSLEASANIQKSSSLVIDRTDFPALYLSNPVISGEAVWLFQARLKDLGYDITPTGRYDNKTSQLVRIFQIANGLEDTGVVSNEEWTALMSIEQDEFCITDGNNRENERLLIVIDVSKRTLVLYKDDEPMKKFPVAVGKSSTPSPLGEWKVVHKSLDWGGGFGTRWMGLNVPWGIYGIHGTNKPGSIGTYASHGCIRMFNKNVEELYPLVPVGTRVKIVEDGKIFPKNLKAQKLKKKAYGQNVVYVQSRLKELGIELDRADGRFGNMTELAIKYFQIWNGLDPGGEMNEETYRAMGMIK